MSDRPRGFDGTADDPRAFPALPSPEVEAEIAATRRKWQADKERFDRRQRIGFRVTLANLFPYMACSAFLTWVIAHLPFAYAAPCMLCLGYMILSQWGQPYLTYWLNHRADRAAEHE
jgi:hypothetical protein